MANPIVSRAELAIGGNPMTVKGVIQKTSLLLGLSAITGVGFFFYALMAGLSQGFITMAAFGSMIAAFVWLFLLPSSRKKPRLWQCLTPC